MKELENLINSDVPESKGIEFDQCVEILFEVRNGQIQLQQFEKLLRIIILFYIQTVRAQKRNMSRSTLNLAGGLFQKLRRHSPDSS